MNGILKWRKPINDELEVWELEEVNSGSHVPVVINKNIYNFEEMKKYPYLCVNTTIVGIVNANRGHVYPEGTLGRDSKGF